VAAALEEEIALYRRFGRHYGYVFFVARLREAPVRGRSVTG
jgi:hypothetical protein